MNETYKEKYEKYTDDELDDAVNQLSSLVSMGQFEYEDELQAARKEARKRGLFL